MAFAQQRRKAFEREPRDWDVLRRAIIGSGMVERAHARRVAIDPMLAWPPEYFAAIAQGYDAMLLAQFGATPERKELPP